MCLLPLKLYLQAERLGQRPRRIGPMFTGTRRGDWAKADASGCRMILWSGSTAWMMPQERAPSGGMACSGSAPGALPCGNATAHCLTGTPGRTCSSGWEVLPPLDTLEGARARPVDLGSAGAAPAPEVGTGG